MSLSIFDIEENIVTRDLKGKIVCFYGNPKSGKTYTACQFPKTLLLAFEKGYSAIAGVKALPINKWSDFKKALRELNKSQAHSMFETVVVDTVDIAYDLCEKYICGKEGVDKIGDLPFGSGYKMVRDEFFEALRQITILEYGLVMISHAVDKEIKPENEDPYIKTFSTLNNRAKDIVFGMSDIIGHSRVVKDKETGEDKMYLFMRETTRFEAGTRWKHMPKYIEFTYDNLVNAIGDAIDKIEEETGVKASNTFTSAYQSVELNYDEIMDNIKSVHKNLVTAKVTNDEITLIVEKHLGKGKKVSQATRDQVEVLVVILDDMKDLLEKKTTKE